MYNNDVLAETGRIIHAEHRFGSEHQNIRSGVFVRDDRELLELYVDAMDDIDFVEVERKLREDINNGKKSAIGY